METLNSSEKSLLILEDLSMLDEATSQIITRQETSGRVLQSTHGTTKYEYVYRLTEHRLEKRKQISKNQEI